LKCLAGSTLSVTVFSWKLADCFVNRFERELEALRKELADATARSGRSSPTSEEGHSSGSGSMAGSPEFRERALAPRAPPMELTMSEDPVAVGNGVEDQASNGILAGDAKKEQ
jgi:hypothetical protein